MNKLHEPDLSLDARSIIDAARLEEDPSGVEVERLRGRVFTHLGIGLATGAAATLAAAATAEAAVASTVATTSTVAATATVATTSTAAATVTAAKVVATTSATVVGAGAGTALSGSSAAASVATASAAGFFAKLGLIGASATAAKLAIAIAVVGAGTAGVVSVSRDAVSGATPVAVTGSAGSRSSESDPSRSHAKPVSNQARYAASSEGATPAPPAEVATPRAEVERSAEPTAKTVASSTELPAESIRPDAPVDSASPVASGEPARPAPVDDPLAEETALVARAQSALAAGRYDEALSAIDDHQRRFPKGVLSQERNGARLLALCGSGQRAQARDAVAAFLAREPSSPLASRLRSVCAIEAAARPGSP